MGVASPVVRYGFLSVRSELLSARLLRGGLLLFEDVHHVHIVLEVLELTEVLQVLEVLQVVPQLLEVADGLELHGGVLAAPAAAAAVVPQAEGADARARLAEHVLRHREHQADVARVVEALQRTQESGRVNPRGPPPFPKKTFLLAKKLSKYLYFSEKSFRTK